MINIDAMTPDEKLEVCDKLREDYGIECYEDMADMCNKLAISVDFILNHNKAYMDDVEKNCLQSLRTLLPLCGHLFIQSDDYYRQ